MTTDTQAEADPIIEEKLNEPVEPWLSSSAQRFTPPRPLTADRDITNRAAEASYEY